MQAMQSVPVEMGLSAGHALHVLLMNKGLSAGQESQVWVTTFLNLPSGHVTQDLRVLFQKVGSEHFTHWTPSKLG